MGVAQLRGVTVAFGGAPVLDEVDLVIEPGERLALIGRNGAGKSTLLKVLDGTLAPDGGEVSRVSGTRVARLDQRVPESATGTALDAVMADRHDAIDEHIARAALSRLGIADDAPVQGLSAGQQRRVLLARALAGEPDLLLLDEPTNHLDVATIADLEEALVRTKPTLVFVTHDRALLRRLATGILDLDRGHLTRHPADYDAYLEERASFREQEASQRALFDKRLAQEESWIREGVRERRKRNMGRVGRLLAMRDERAVRRDATGTVRMEADAAGRSGRVVARAHDLGITLGGRTLVKGFTTQIDRGDRIGIVGPNGAGKTTLVRVLLGELAATEGKVELGTNVAVGYFDQIHASLDLAKSAVDNVADGASTVTVNGKERHVLGYLASFLFSAEQARHPVSLYSGGERNRLLLARLFARPSNVLVLDEPTNDLDMETMEVLEALLADYEGTILLVSHDRALLEATVERLWVLDGEGDVREIVGGPVDWRRLGAPEPAAEARKRSTTPAKPAKAAPALDKHQRKELKDLPARIETLETELARRHEAMADPAFFRQDGATIAAARTALEALEAKIAEAYARWEELSALEAGGSSANRIS